MRNFGHIHFLNNKIIITSLFEGVVAVTFQNTFHSEIHQNDVFLFLKLIHQNDFKT
jgi:hypothetical protein